MLTKVIKHMVLSADTREDFYSDSKNASIVSSKRGMELAAAIVTFVVVILILSVVGKYLWNAVLAGDTEGTGLLTVARKADTIWQILGLYILSALLFGN